MKRNNHSLRNFPPDLLLASGIPIVAITFFVSWVFSLRDWQWIIAYCCALLIAIVGAVYLFRAKLPLYRQKKYLTLGTGHLPPASILLYQRGRFLSFAGIAFAVLLLLASLLQKGF
jgi:uncharacterized membrane protein SirB2